MRAYAPLGRCPNSMFRMHWMLQTPFRTGTKQREEVSLVNRKQIQADNQNEPRPELKDHTLRNKCVKKSKSNQISILGCFLHPYLDLDLFGRKAISRAQVRTKLKSRALDANGQPKLPVVKQLPITVLSLC